MWVRVYVFVWEKELRTLLICIICTKQCNWTLHDSRNQQRRQMQHQQWHCCCCYCVCTYVSKKYPDHTDGRCLSRPKCDSVSFFLPFISTSIALFVSLWIKVQLCALKKRLTIWCASSTSLNWKTIWRKISHCQHSLFVYSMSIAEIRTMGLSVVYHLCLFLCITFVMCGFAIIDVLICVEWTDLWWWLLVVVNTRRRLSLAD